MDSESVYQPTLLDRAFNALPTWLSLIIFLVALVAVGVLNWLALSWHKLIVGHRQYVELDDDYYGWPVLLCQDCGRTFA